MTDAESLVRELECQGVTLAVRDGMLLLGGNKAAIDPHKDEIRRLKEEIMGLIKPWETPVYGKISHPIEANGRIRQWDYRAGKWIE